MKRPALDDLVMLLVDDTTGLSPKWVERSYLNEHETYPIEAVGWVAHKDARFVSLAGIRDLDLANDTVGQVVRVPWGCIRKVTVLRKAR